MKKKKCYIYMRVSTAMQTEGYSLDAQRGRLLKFAEFHEMEVVGEYCDAGKSGKSISGRPEFMKMLQDVADNKEQIDYILVFKLSRFGRNAADVLNSLQYIQDYGVNLICVEDGIDSSKDSGKLTITVLSAVAEIERDNILVQTMEGRKQKAREGKWNGGQAPYGYILDSKHSILIVNPEEAKVVKLIFYLYVHVDMGVDAICDYLNSHGYSKKKVKNNEVTYFTRGFVIGVLDNPVYIGKIAYGKYKTERVKGTRDQYSRVKQDTYILVDGLHESIIDDDTWDAAREKRARTGVKWNKTHSLSHEHVLSGIIKCPLCGVGMSGTVQRRKNKKSGEYKDTFYYRCHHRRKADGLMCDYRPMLPQTKIDDQIEQLIGQMASNERMRDFVKEKLEAKIDVSYLEREKVQLTGQLQQVNGSRKKLIQMIDQLDAGDKYYDRKHQDMEDRLDALFDKTVELEEMIEEVSEKIKAANRNQISGKQVYQFLSRFDILYGKMTDLEKKEFMRSFVDTIELYPDEKDMTRIIKHVNLQFPIYYGECEGDQIRMPNESTVETVCLLGKRKPDATVKV